jgi:flavin-dependent dehydrogenase
MRSTWDVIVVGAGPAGSAAAILCAGAGLRTLLLEREAFPRARPGETLHPGVESLLGRLGVLSAVESAGFLRHEGVQVSWGGESAWQPYGSTGGKPWMGYQAPRDVFDRILLDRARAVGAQVREGCGVEAPLVLGGRVVGVQCESGPEHAAFVLDATGRRRWLSRALGLQVEQASRVLVARYGYLRGPLGDERPSLMGNEEGWWWTAPVEPTTLAWVQLGFGRAAPAIPPVPVRGLSRLGRDRAEDVTWYRVMPAGGAGYFLLGDAASRLDPASSHGVLKALLSGEQAARAIVSAMNGSMPESVASGVYEAWTGQLFAHDCSRLGALYARLGATAARITDTALR